MSSQLRIVSHLGKKPNSILNSGTKLNKWKYFFWGPRVTLWEITGDIASLKLTAPFFFFFLKKISRSLDIKTMMVKTRICRIESVFPFLLLSWLSLHGQGTVLSSSLFHCRRPRIQKLNSPLLNRILSLCSQAHWSWAFRWSKTKLASSSTRKPFKYLQAFMMSLSLVFLSPS